MRRPSLAPRLVLVLAALAVGWSLGHLTSGRLQSRSHAAELARLAGDELTAVLADERYAEIEGVLERFFRVQRVVAVHWVAKDGTPRLARGAAADGLAPPAEGGVYQGRNLVAWVRLPALDWLRLELKAHEPSPWFPGLAVVALVAAWLWAGRGRERVP